MLDAIGFVARFAIKYGLFPPGLRSAGVQRPPLTSTVVPVT